MIDSIFPSKTGRKALPRDANTKLSALNVGSFSFECIIVSANLFYKLSESTFYKEMSKFSQKSSQLKVLD